MDEADQLDQQFEEAWTSGATFAPAESKDLCKYWWLRERIAGVDSGIEKMTLPGTGARRGDAS